MLSQAIVLREVEGLKGQVYYPLEKVAIEVRSPEGRELLVRVSAAAFNHRDLFSRKNLYPKITFGVPICCDGAGVVIRVGSGASPAWLNRRVIVNPGRGWDRDPDFPESPSGYTTLGASPAGTGTLQQYMLVDEKDVLLTPDHLSDVEAAALPAVGLTAWRAVIIKSRNVVPGRNILITGIGGGVALMAMSFALAAGCAVYVTSSSEEKLRRAKELGASAGVNYKKSGWEEELLALLPPERTKFDAILDGAGGDIMKTAVRLLKPAGVVVSYGMTLGPSTPFPMKAEMHLLDLVSASMGSRKEFADLMDCIRVHKIKPVISRIVNGLDDIEQIESLFDELQRGSQFGKLVVKLDNKDASSKL
ncbi:uncharacterized protein A1O9_10990 [Exophiala aquamarina CBS 119918]|uniref:Enoyl reductase (ER) domain-containing protein n=1 Tax=Exophiala aquamarina CBS 119918 TaxID=1182545 RepID=A0A072P080_9EURO|nr:uncharacterized protein A1O9_10990 [Exophiala aquamarina CBS 119918]KEF53082.1 hypothetical protein A1O9_10990 [Exophiala aquamarina CBS 119918]